MPLSRVFNRCIALLLAAACVGACAVDPERVYQRELTRARAAFVSGDYLTALELFSGIDGPGATSAERELGLARCNQQLRDYEVALRHYRRALELTPDEGLAWRGYIQTLRADGVQRRDDTRLAEVLDVAPTALRAAPARVEIYPEVLESAAILDRLDDYAPLLDALVATLPDRPVPRIELFKAQIQSARRARSAALAELEGELRVWLEELAARSDMERDVVPGVHYALAVGYDLLREPEGVDAALRALERTDGGRTMAARLRYEQFLGEWVRTIEAAPEARVALADRWLERFAPGWEDDPTFYRDILGMQFDVMVAAARSTLGAGDEQTAGVGTRPAPAPEDAAVGSISEEQADRIATVGRRLARIDTDYGAIRYEQTAGILSQVPTHYITAVRVATDGIDALRADRPGLLHPVTPLEEREMLRRDHLAELLRIKAQALRNLGRDDEATNALAEALDLEAQRGPAQ